MDLTVKQKNHCRIHEEFESSIYADSLSQPLNSVSNDGKLSDASSVNGGFWTSCLDLESREVVAVFGSPTAVVKFLRDNLGTCENYPFMIWYHGSIVTSAHGYCWRRSTDAELSCAQLSNVDFETVKQRQHKQTCPQAYNPGCEHLGEVDRPTFSCENNLVESFVDEIRLSSCNVSRSQQLEIQARDGNIVDPSTFLIEKSPKIICHDTTLGIWAKFSVKTSCYKGGISSAPGVEWWVWEQLICTPFCKAQNCSLNSPDSIPHPSESIDMTLNNDSNHSGVGESSNLSRAGEIHSLSSPCLSSQMDLSALRSIHNNGPIIAQIRFDAVANSVPSTGDTTEQSRVIINELNHLVPVDWTVAPMTLDAPWRRSAMGYGQEVGGGLNSIGNELTCSLFSWGV